MYSLKRAGLIAAICAAALLTGCGRTENTKKTDTGSTAHQADAEYANADLERDSEREETGQEERKAAMDLFREDGDICTQFLRLTPPEEWEDNVTYHYFQEPEIGRYGLDIVENGSMAATEGVGGRVFSVVLAGECPEEPPGEKYDYLGTLENEEDKLFYVIIEYPEGTQFTEGSEESYKRILDASDGMTDRIEGRNGFTFKTGEYPGNTEE